MSDTPRTDACLADLKTRSGFLPDAKWVDLCRELERGSARVGLKPSLCATCGQTKYLPDPNCALAGCPGSASNGRGPNDGGFCDCFSKCGDAPGWEDKLCRQPHGMLASPPVGDMRAEPRAEINKWLRLDELAAYHREQAERLREVIVALMELPIDGIKAVQTHEIPALIAASLRHARGCFNDQPGSVDCQACGATFRGPEMDDAPKMARPASEITCPFCHGVWTLGPMPDVPPKGLIP